MGFLKGLASFGKKLLQPVVGAGRAIQTLRDKGIGLFNKVKDALPTQLKSALDTGVEYLMNTPIGSAMKKASGLLDTGVTIADEAHKKLSEYESQGGPPIAAQLQAIGDKVNEGQSGPSDEQQANRLATLKQE